ncbi:MAG: EamA family transporter [Bacillota bacterium]
MANVAILWILGAIFSVQGGAALAKQLFPVLGADGATFFRVWFSALVLFAIWRPWRHRLSLKTFRYVAVYGLSLGLMNWMFYQALARIPLGIAVAVEFTGPLGIAILSSRKGLDYLWALLAGVGIAMILPRSDFSGNIDAVGVLFALAAGVCWAIYIIVAKKLGSYIAGGRATAWGMMAAAISITPMTLHAVPWATLNVKTVLIAIAVAILSSSLPYSLEMKALRHVPSKTFGILMSLEPAAAALFGLAFLSEQLTLIQWMAVACVMVASLGTTLSHSQKDLQ